MFNINNSLQLNFLTLKSNRCVFFSEKKTWWLELVARRKIVSGSSNEDLRHEGIGGSTERKCFVFHFHVFIGVSKEAPFGIQIL